MVHRRRKRTIHAAAVADRSMQQAERMHVHASRMQPGEWARSAGSGTFGRALERFATARLKWDGSKHKS